MVISNSYANQQFDSKIAQQLNFTKNTNKHQLVIHPFLSTIKQEKHIYFSYIPVDYIYMLIRKIFATFSTETKALSRSKLVKQLMELTKFKLSVLNGIVTTASYSLYATQLSCLPLFASSILLSMSTQALNQYIEIQYDRKMLRTSQRPLVLGMNPNIALGGGIGLGALGLWGLSYYNPLSAGIGLSIWASYLFIYTRMKRQSTSNTFVGSIIGSLPVYLGWAASGRSICMAEPFALFLYMMAWQHQHFYGIRWIYEQDYDNAGFKMQKDRKYAATAVIVQTIMSFIMMTYSLRYFQITDCYLFSLPLAVGLYKWGIIPALQFSEKKITAKDLKMLSYKHFTLVFAIFLLCSLMDKRQGKIDTSERKYPSKNNSDQDITADIYL